MDETTFAAFNGIFYDQTLGVNPEDSDSFYSDESAQSALIQSLQNLINSKKDQAQIFDKIESDDNENSITMDLCLEENNNVTTNIPLKGVETAFAKHGILKIFSKILKA